MQIPGIFTLRNWVSKIALLSLFLTTSDVYAQIHIHDDFTNGNFDDDSPVTWNLDDSLGFAGEMRLTADGLELSGSGFSHGAPIFPTVDGRVLIMEDGVFRMESRFDTSVFLAPYLRLSPTLDGRFEFYFGGASQGPDIFLERVGANGREWIDTKPNDWVNQDIFMEFSTIGDQLELRVWPTDEDRPAEAQLSRVDNKFASGGSGFAFAGGTMNDTALIRSIDITVLPATAPGDVNDDQLLDARDLDLIAQNIDLDVTELRYDIDGDLRINLDDVSTWVRDLKNTFSGDANLDGIVSFPDFLSLSASFGQSGGWAEGDFNSDGIVGFPDFLILSKNFGATAVASSVPEPSGCALLGVASCFVGLLREKRYLSCNKRHAS